ncbi:MAG TPA: hypothetical protein VJ802_07350 [Gemmatimonadaceae bacterium]|nr:hypothetical protein [Gemmatimonadaceae bacterium]
MNARVVVASLVLACSVAPAVAAQSAVDSRCMDPALVGESNEGQDACQKAIDLLNYMTPQLGTLIAGGNATIGQGGTLGGLGHFALSVRANAMRASLPDIDGAGVNYGTAQRSNYVTEAQWAALPVVDAAFGLFKGIPLPLTNVLGVDVLVNVSYLPELEHHPLSLTTPDGSFKFGYGARIGVLQESLVLPGISVSYMKRDLPRTTLIASWEGGALASADTARLENFEIGTTSWRVVASKSLLAFSLALGVGQDRYEAEAGAFYSVNEPLARFEGGPVRYAFDVTRTNVFLDLITNLGLMKIVATVGGVSGGDIPTYNNFDKEADASRIYGSLGFRIGL